MGEHGGGVPVKAADLLSNPWAFGPQCLVVGEVITFSAPICGVRGMQGTWPLDSALQAVIRAQTGHEVTKGFTLLQPYASAIAIGPKRIENRPQARRIPPGGLWLGLHAGKTLYDSAEAIRRVWVDKFGIWPFCPELADLPMGAMLGIMRIDQCLRYPETQPSPGLFR